MIAKSRFSKRWHWQMAGWAALVGTFSLGVSSGIAQIVPDNTLGNERSVVAPAVTIQGIDSDRIEGGAIRGANLFHSFSQFNIGEGRGAYFTNPAGIDNILSRVTGANRSDILGRLGVLGNANLFLINPTGIVFGSSASLDVQGSFLATTANAVRLGDMGLFSASQPATSNLLSVSPSAFWFNAVAAQSIVNRSRSQGSLNQPNVAGLPPGLQVQPNRTLALVGGDVLLEAGRLTAAGGRIELGSVTAGNVNLTQSGSRFQFGYDTVQNFGAIALSNRAFVDTSGEGSGDIQIQGARLEMTQNSTIRANTLGAQPGGEVLIRTTETSLNQGSPLRIEVAPDATGKGGNLTIETRRLFVRDGSVVSTSTFGAGDGGKLQVTASELIEVAGRSLNRQVSSALFSQSNASGNAGDIRLNTGRLIVRDAAAINTATFGSSKGGNFQIDASESVEVIAAADGDRSVIGTQSLGNGDAGNLTIKTRRLLVRDGATVSTTTIRGAGKGGNLQINASESVEVIGTAANRDAASALVTQTGVNQTGARATGDAGNLSIDTKRLLVQGGAGISVGTFGEGKGGNLQIDASEIVEVIGRSANGVIPSALVAVRGTQASGAKASGDAGNISISTERLIVRDRAVITSASFANGRAGNINITALNALEANNGAIETSTTRSAGGAIAIQSGTIRLFGNSDIRSEVESGADNGGAITLTADSILAFADSDILAFAQNGAGGNITLNTPAFFGENYRPAPRGINPLSLDNNNRVDLNATGAISGIITIPDVSFIQNSLTELPDNQINTDTLLANSCIIRLNQPTQGSFRITGTGGFSQRPGDAQISSFPTVSVETLPSDSQSSSVDRTWQKGNPIVEPQGVYRLPNGKVVLSRNCF